MNNIDFNIMLNIIQSKLFTRYYPLPESVDWDEVALLLKNQGMILFLEDCINDIPIEKEKGKEYKRIILNQKLQWERINAVTDNIMELCRKAGIACAVIKGSAAAMYYPDPHLRAAGDIDLLVPAEDFDKCRHLLIDVGYIENESNYPQGSHIEFTKNNIEVELHYRYIRPQHERQDQILSPYIYSGFKNVVYKKIGRYKFETLPVNQGCLVYIYHIFFHLQNGIGLRQVIDWMMFVHNSSLRDWKEVNDISQRAGLFELQKDITRMCELYLGLPHRADLDWRSDVDEKLCEQLMEYVLNCGNFGNNCSEEELKAKFFSNVTSAFSRLQAGGMLRWKVAQKHKILMPFAWAYQAGRVGFLLIKGKKQIRKLKTDIKKGEKQREMFRKLGFEDM